MRHQQFLEAGVRTFGISIDAPELNAAMVAKLSLPFPILSDPDRSQAISPFGVADEKDQRLYRPPCSRSRDSTDKEVFRFDLATSLIGYRRKSC